MRSSGTMCSPDSVVCTCALHKLAPSPAIESPDQSIITRAAFILILVFVFFYFHFVCFVIDCKCAWFLILSCVG